VRIARSRPVGWAGIVGALADEHPQTALQVRSGRIGFNGRTVDTRARKGHETTMALAMIVDDDTHIQLALRQIVESAGHRVIEAGNGQDAIELFEEFRPDLVITDVFMLDTDGIETIRAVRRIMPGAKIIAISGNISATAGTTWVRSAFSAPIWRSRSLSPAASYCPRSIACWAGGRPSSPIGRNPPPRPAERQLRVPSRRNERADPPQSLGDRPASMANPDVRPDRTPISSGCRIPFGSARDTAMGARRGRNRRRGRRLGKVPQPSRGHRVMS